MPPVGFQPVQSLYLLILSADALSLNFNWTVEQELLLFEAMMGHKPVGADKNIHMMCIHRYRCIDGI